MNNEEKSDDRKITELMTEGHTNHCAKRQVWGDGECECQKKKKHDPYAWINAVQLPKTEDVDFKVKEMQKLTPIEKFIYHFVPRNSPSKEGSFRAWLSLAIRHILGELIDYEKQAPKTKSVNEPDVIEIEQPLGPPGPVLGPLNLNMDNIQFKNLHHSAVDILSVPNFSGGNLLHTAATNYLEDLFRAARADLKGGSTKDGDLS